MLHQPNRNYWIQLGILYVLEKLFAMGRVRRYSLPIAGVEGSLRMVPAAHAWLTAERDAIQAAHG